MTFTKEKLDRVFCYFVLFVFLEPPVLSYYPQLSIISKMFGAMRYVLGSVFFVAMFIRSVNGVFKKQRLLLADSPKKPVVFMGRNNYTRSMWILFYAVLLNAVFVIAAYCNHTVYLTFILSCLSKVGFVSFFLSSYHRMRNSFFRCIVVLMTAYCTMHMLLQLFIPRGVMGHGDARVWLLGLKNGATLFLLLDLIITGILYEKNRSKKLLALILFINLCTIINRSSTGIIVVLLFDMILYVKLKRRQSLVFNKITLSAAFLFIWGFFYVVVCKNEELMISAFVSKMMGKTPTFSGRVAIWKLALQTYEMNKPWGAGSSLEFHPWGDPANVVYSAHNTILDILCRYGIFAAVTFSLIMVAIFLQCLQLKDKKLAIFSCGCIVTLFLAMMFEAEGNGYLFWSIVVIPFLITDRKIKVLIG